MSNIFRLPIVFTEVNPDKGTETIFVDFVVRISSLPFTEVNPDKGTETQMHL